MVFSVRRHLLGFELRSGHIHLNKSELTFKQQVSIYFELFRYQSNSRLFTGLNRAVYYPRTGARTGRALSYAYRRLFARSRRTRSSKVTVVVTDGRSLDDVHRVSKQLRARGVTIYSVGVGRYFNARELDSMATDPDKTHVFTSDFKQLQYITNDLKKAICLSKCSACRYSVPDFENIS